MRGIDPRDFTLLAFGGAGPLHAAPIAEELGIAQVIVPPLPGAFSAYGLLVADRRHDASQTRVMSVESASLDDVRTVIEPMREQAARELAEEGFAPEDMRFEAFVDMRFVGQAFELTTPIPRDARSIDDLVAAFHTVYEQRYAHADQGKVETVSFRIAAYGVTEKPHVPSVAVRGGVDDAQVGKRPIYFAGETIDTPIYRRDALPEAARITGPAIVDEAGSATVVPPDFSIAQHQSGALILTREST
jgi:N-methylhydantoinase A